MGDFISEQSCTVVEGTHYTYRINTEGDACIESCKSACQSVRIPEALGGHPVAAIGDSAFSMLSRIETVVCPCALRHIGRHAFEGCLKLKNVSLNFGLQSIGEEAFFLCASLAGLDVPASVERFGPRPLGSSRSIQLRTSPSFEIRFDPASNRLFFDELGVLYERHADGLVLVDGYRFEGDRLICKDGTVEIGPRALSGMPDLKHVSLPEGVKRIGDKAFCGSTGLRTVSFPASLEQIGHAAFSCTSLESISIPKRCIDIDSTAFALGTVSGDGTALSYASHLSAIDVDDENPVFCMKGGVLCRRLLSGKLEALLAPALCNHVELGQTIACVRATAFAGTAHIDKLSIADGIAFETESGRFSHCEIGAIELTAGGIGNQTIVLPFPQGPESRSIIAQGTSGAVFDSHMFLKAYDEVVAALAGSLVQARLVISRLARPIALSPHMQRRFRMLAEKQLVPLCIAFGQRGEFDQYDLMADAGILHANNIADVSNALAVEGDAQSIGYLLDLKQRRFGRASWDEYEL